MKSVLPIFFILFSYILVAQDQNVADSFKLLLPITDVDDSIYLFRLKELAFNEQDPAISEKYCDLLISASIKQKNDYYLQSGYFQKGNAEKLQGNLSDALSSYFQSNDIALKLEDKVMEGINYCNIADVYSISDNEKNAISYYTKGISTLRLSADTIQFATAILNLGDEYLNQHKYQEALEKFKESGALFQQVGYEIGNAYNLGNIGISYAGLGDPILAESNMNAAIEILEEMEDYYSISIYLTYLSDIYHDRHDHENAVLYAKRSLELAENYNLKDQISDACLQLSELYDHVGDSKNSLKLYKQHISYRDSFHNLEVMQDLANLRTDQEVSQKQLEVDLLEQTKKNQQISIIGSLIGLAFAILLALGLYRRYRYVHRTNKIIEDEKKRSDELLLNILPEETAAELKQNGKVAAKKFDSTTVLFSDFVGFTKQAEKLSPEELVESIDYYFSNFDAIIHKYDLEKIKTVGDAYLCAGGLPFPTTDHHVRIILAAKDIAAFVAKAKQSHLTGKTSFDVRIGVNSGPLVAGVVGTKKFAYDIWGDTVNIASRMETNSAAGKINVSENTYQYIKDYFECEYQGDFVTKNGSKIKMYYVGDQIKEVISEKKQAATTQLL